jgi:2'-5' RNA ligase
MDAQRVFVALDIADDARARIAEAAAALRARIPPAWRASLVAREKIHITLKFLGHLAPHVVASMRDAVTAAATAHPTPPARVAGLTAFPDPSRASVLIVELTDPSGQLAAIAADVESSAASLGVAREPRPYRPHVTLARVREPRNARALLTEAPPLTGHPVGITGLTLYRSDLTPGGATYTPIVRAALHPRAP